MRSLFKRFPVASVLIAALVVGFVPSPARAQIPAPQPIEGPVPFAWRVPFEQFLRDLRLDEAVIGTTKAGYIGGAFNPDSLVFRVEDQRTCFQNLCLTIIGRIIDEKFVADVMFVAGNKRTWGDHSQSLFGFQAMPLWFEGDKTTVLLYETPKGWLVVPQSK